MSLTRPWPWVRPKRLVCIAQYSLLPCDHHHHHYPQSSTVPPSARHYEVPLLRSRRSFSSLLVIRSSKPSRLPHAVNSSSARHKSSNRDENAKGVSIDEENDINSNSGREPHSHSSHQNTEGKEAAAEGNKSSSDVNRSLTASSATTLSSKPHARPHPLFPTGKYDPENPAQRKALLAQIPPYSPEEMELLKAQYTPEQIAAIEAGEKAIDLDDLLEQGVLRHDPMAPAFLDDLSKLDPVIDKPVRAPEDHYDRDLRVKDDDELASDLADWIQKMGEKAQASQHTLSSEEDQGGRGHGKGVKDQASEAELLDPVEWERFLDTNRLTVSSEGGHPLAEKQPHSSESNPLPKLQSPIIRSQARAARADASNDEMAAQYEHLSKVTGLSTKFMRSLRAKVLVERRVVNQTRMGKVSSHYILSVVGNGKGLVGIGEGKSAEMGDARRQSASNAIRNMVPIRRYEGRTIFGDVKAKVGGTELELYNRPPGFGIRTQGRIYEICKCVGIHDIAARVSRSRNPMNTVKATIQALQSQRFPEDVARGRGLKLVDLRRVYYGKSLS